MGLKTHKFLDNDWGLGLQMHTACTKRSNFQVLNAHQFPRKKTGSQNARAPCSLAVLAHQNRTIAIASDFRVDGAKSPEARQKEGVLGKEMAARNRKSLATFHRNLQIAMHAEVLCIVSEIASDFQGVAFTGVQVLREKMFISLHEKWVRRTAKMK